MQEAVEACRSRLTRRALLARVLVVLSLTVLFPLVVVAGDHLWSGGLPRGLLRAVLTVWGLAVTVTLLGTVLVTLLRRLSPIFIARHLERAHGIRHNTVVNALLLRRDGQATYAENAALRRAAGDLAAQGPARAPELSPSRLSGLLLLATLAVWVLYVVSSPKPIGPSVARFFGADVPAPTATWLELVRPGPEDVAHVGEPLEIEIAMHGRPVTDVIFEILGPGGEPDEALRQYTLSESVGAGVDRRQVVLAPFVVTGDLHYRCRAGDGKLEGVIPVHPRPDVETLAVDLTPPAYTGWPAERNAGADLNVLAGTQAAFALRANVAIADPVFVLFDGRREARTRMTVPPGSPREARLSLTLSQSGTYHVEFNDRWGYALRDPRSHTITVRGDLPPRVELAVPSEADAGGGAVDVRGLAELIAIAEDDVGIATLTFHYQPQGAGAAETRNLPLGGAGDRDSVSGRVPVADLPLRPGSMAIVWFQAEDGRVLPSGRPAPQSATSSKVTLVWPAEERSRKRRSAESDKPDQGQDAEPGTQEDEKPADGGNCDEDGNGAGSGDDQAHGPDEGKVQGDAADDYESGSGMKSDEEEDGEDASGEDGFGEGLDEFVKRHGQQAQEALRGAREARDAENDSTAGSPTDQGQEQESGGPERENTNESSDESESGSDEQSGDSPQPSGEAADQEQTDSDKQDAADSAGAKPGECSGGETGGSATGETNPAAGKEASEESSDSGKESEDSSSDGQPDGASEGPANSPGGGGEPGADDAGGGAESAEPDAADSSPAKERPLAEVPDDSTGLPETLELLEMLERGEGITADMLTDAGWSAREAAEFVRDLRALHAAARRAGSVGTGRFTFDARVGDAERRAGGGVSDDVVQGAGAVQRHEDKLRRITPPAEQTVPAPLQKLLDAYYRALAAKSAGE